MNLYSLKFITLIIFLFCLKTTNIMAANNNPSFIDLVALDLKGKIFDLKEKRGKVVIVNFWASWCKVCRQEMPILQELYNQYKKDGLELIAISIDAKSSLREVTNIAAEFNYPHSIFYQVKTNSLSEPRIVPVNYIINKKGELVARLLAEEKLPTKEQFEEILKPLLRPLHN